MQKLHALCSRLAPSTSSPRASRGFALVEALVAAAILSSVLAFSVGAYLLAAQTAGTNGPGVEATYLADEGVEAMRLLRDSGWSANIATLTSGTPYYLSWNGTTWTTTSANTYIDGVFERSVTLSDVYRDANDDIAASGTLDPNAKQVTVTVSWLQGSATSTRTLTAYITNLFAN